MIARAPLAAIALACSGPAAAQVAPSFGVEVSNDEVRRGLSWSSGRASASADASLSLGPIEASARAAALRGSERHLDADAVVDLGLATSFDLGGPRLRLEAIHHAFQGTRGKADYSEFGPSLTYDYGPAQLTAGAVYAPSQSAIGGDNLYLFAGASVGIPVTPFSVSAGVGHSSGDADDIRSQRLRPGGAYTDWRVGGEYRLGLVSVAVDYLGNDATGADDRIVGRVRFGF